MEFGICLHSKGQDTGNAWLHWQSATEGNPAGMRGVGHAAGVAGTALGVLLTATAHPLGHPLHTHGMPFAHPWGALNLPRLPFHTSGEPFAHPHTPWDTLTLFGMPFAHPPDALTLFGTLSHPVGCSHAVRDALTLFGML